MGTDPGRSWATIPTPTIDLTASVNIQKESTGKITLKKRENSTYCKFSLNLERNTLVFLSSTISNTDTNLIHKRSCFLYTYWLNISLFEFYLQRNFLLCTLEVWQMPAQTHTQSSSQIPRLVYHTTRKIPSYTSWFYFSYIFLKLDSIKESRFKCSHAGLFCYLKKRNCFNQMDQNWSML